MLIAVELIFKSESYIGQLASRLSMVTFIETVNHLLNRGQINTDSLEPSSVVLVAITLRETFLSTAQNFRELFLHD